MVTIAKARVAEDTVSGVHTVHTRRATYEHLTRDPIGTVAEMEHRHRRDLIYPPKISPAHIQSQVCISRRTAITPSTERHRLVVPVSLRAKLRHALGS